MAKALKVEDLILKPNFFGEKSGKRNFLEDIKLPDKKADKTAFEQIADKKLLQENPSFAPNTKIEDLYKLPEIKTFSPAVAEEEEYSQPAQTSVQTQKEDVKTPETDMMMKGLGSLQAAYSRLATNTGKQTSLRETREQNELEALTNAQTGLFPKQAAVLEGQLNVLNEKYNDYLANSEGSKAELDKVQAKYPVLSRADVIGNMSTAEKVTTALMTVLASAGGVPPAQNPAFAVFNKSVDDAVEKSKQSYERERLNILQKHSWDVQDFEVFDRKIKSQADMTNNIFQNNLAMTKAKGMMKSDQEIALDEKIAADTITAGAGANMLNAYAQLQNMQQTKRAVDFKIKTAYANMQRVSSEYIIENGELKSQEKPFVYKTEELAEKTTLANEEDVGALRILDAMLLAIKADDTNNVSTLIAAAEKYKFKFPKTEHFFTSLTSPKNVMKSEAAIDQLRHFGVDQINKRNQQNSFTLEELAAFQKGL